LPEIISFIFLIICAVYFFYGVMVLSFNSKSTQHRVLFFSFICLSWWAFAFTIANNAPDYGTALFWRRLASAGWGIYYSLLFHYILILTEKNTLLQKPWLYPLLYLPAALNVFLYGIYDETALLSYHLLKTPLGWTNVAGITAMDMAHFASYIGFSLASIVTLIHWGVTAKEQVKRITALIISCSALLALIIGTLTDHLISVVFQVNFPQIGPIVIMFPALTMFYCIWRYSLMRDMPRDMAPKEDHLLSEHTQARLFLYLALAAFLGSFVGFASLFFTDRAPLETTLVFSGVFFLAGIFIYVTRNLNMKADAKDAIAGVVLAVTLLVLTVIIYEFTTSHSWYMPVMFLLTVVIFNNITTAVLLGISALLSLIWSWANAPTLLAPFTEVDHAVRLTIITVMFGFALYFNRILKQAVTESQKKAGREKVLSDIASALMTASDTNIDAKIKEVMSMWGRHIQANRMDIFFLDHAQRTIKSTYKWCGSGIKPAVALETFKKEEIFEAATGLNRLWDEGDAGDLKPDALAGSELQNKWAEKMKDGKLMIIPLKNADQLIGVLAIEKVSGKSAWKEEQQKKYTLSRMITDVWLKIEADKKIKHEAYHDSLTGLPNRQHFTDRLKQAINMAMRTDKLVGVLFIDIDSFKYVNDSLGHEGGDLFLQQIGQGMKKSVREYDVVARFGGDEFLIMVPQADDIADIERVAAKVLESLKEPMAVREQKINVSASMGIAVYPIDGDGPDALLKNADIAMYTSKEIGRNRYMLCSSTLKNDAQANIALTKDLHWALERNELFLHYQPQLNTETGKIAGVEALLRWKRQHLGIISPSVFIPLAEKNGQISSIGAWVISQACYQNKMWQEAGLKPIPIAVNLSLGQFMDANLIEVVQNSLEASGVNPELLELVITGSIATHGSQNFADTMDRLKAIGVKLAIDNFGSGCSPLDRLKVLPIDKIKIDKRFVHGIGSSTKDEEIIKVILQLGKTFGIKVAAEGVEDERQFLFLKENSCDEIQGYYCFKPMTACEIIKVLTNQR